MYILENDFIELLHELGINLNGKETITVSKKNNETKILVTVKPYGKEKETKAYPSPSKYISQELQQTIKFS